MRNKAVKIALNVFFMANVFAFGLISFAQDASKLASDPNSSTRGMEIAKLRKQHDTGWVNSEAKMTMKLIDSQGDSSTRKIRLNSLEVQDDGDKTLTIFDEPRDIQGTAFLNHSHPSTADDQWLYLPALKRVKRIASQNKSGPFMGSEFSYEDLSSFEIEKFSYTFLRDEIALGKQAFVIEQTPTDPYSGYTRQVVWLDQKGYYPLKIEFYDRKNSLIKTLIFNDYQKHLNQYWRAHELAMTNHQTGNKTVLTIDAIEFRTSLKERDFSKNHLKSIR